MYSCTKDSHLWCFISIVISELKSFLFIGNKRTGTVGRNEIHRTVVAVFNQGGVTGEIVFSQEFRTAPVDIQVNLVGLDQFSDAYRWSIHEHPIRRSLLSNYPCSEVGNIFYPDNPGGNIPSCVGNPAACAVGDLTGKLGRLRNDLTTQIFRDSNLDLFGSESIVGRSILINREDGPSGAFICANIELNGRPSRRVQTLRASFNNGIIQGDVIIRDPDGFDEVTVEADLYSLNGAMLSNAKNISWTLNFGPAYENCTGVGQVCEWIVGYRVQQTYACIFRLAYTLHEANFLKLYSRVH